MEGWSVGALASTSHTSHLAPPYLHIAVECGQHERRAPILIPHIDMAVSFDHLCHHLTKLTLTIQAVLTNRVVERAHTRPLIARVEVGAEADEPVDLRACVT